MTLGQWAGLALMIVAGAALAGMAVWRLARPHPGTHVAGEAQRDDDVCPDCGSGPGVLCGAPSGELCRWRGSMNLAEERSLHTATVAWGLADDGGWISGPCRSDDPGGSGEPDVPVLTDDQWLASLHDDDEEVMPADSRWTAPRSGQERPLVSPGVGAEWSPAAPAPAQDHDGGWVAQRTEHHRALSFGSALEGAGSTPAPPAVVPATRLADTGDVASARLLAEIAAHLRAQDDDTAAWLSRFRQDCQQARLDLTGALT